jgi:lambda repressor-like predicted transcriptional regulator
MIHAADPTTHEAAARLTPAARQRIDEWMLPLRSVAPDRLDAEIGDRLARVCAMRHCLCVLADHGCSGLEASAPRVQGTAPAELQRLYACLVLERDPLLARATQEWRPIVASLDEHRAWISAQVRNAGVLLAWLDRNAQAGARHLAAIPARGWLSRGALFAFLDTAPGDPEVFALFYAAQRLALALDMRQRPYVSELLSMRFTARELDVLRAGLRGQADDEIAAGLDLSVDAIRYYYKKFKGRVPVTMGHLKPRDLARILHHVGRL